MFESMKMFLKNKIDVGNEVTRIRTKLHTFLTHNPDVDHYLCEATNYKYRINFWLGIFLGFLISLMIFMFAALAMMYYWHALGYLNLPGGVLA